MVRFVWRCYDEVAELKCGERQEREREKWTVVVVRVGVVVVWWLCGKS